MARTPKSRGALTILALLLAASSAIRFGEGVGHAFAAGPVVSEPTPDHAAMESCPTMPAALAKALSDREARVDVEEAALQARRIAIDLADEAITAKLKELEAAEAKLAETLALADGAAEKDLTRLTAVYEAMKPKDAALLFENMAPEFSAGFLGRMRPEAAAAVLAGMTAEKAYAISVLLAGRNASVPKQ